MDVALFSATFYIYLNLFISKAKKKKKALLQFLKCPANITRIKGIRGQKKLSQACDINLQTIIYIYCTDDYVHGKFYSVASVYPCF